MGAGTGLLEVGVGKAVGLAFWEEAGVPSTVVADENGSSAEVHDLDPMGVAGLFRAMVVVAATMDRVDRAGRHSVTGLLLRGLALRRTFPPLRTYIHGTP